MAAFFHHFFLGRIPSLSGSGLTISVKNDVDCYVFVKVEKQNDYDKFMAHAMALGWTELTDGSGICYRTVTENAADKEFSVLGAGSIEIDEKTYSWGANQVLIRPDVTKAMMDKLYVNDSVIENVPKLSFTAYACQQEGFATPEDAWAEVQTTVPLVLVLSLVLSL